MAKACEEAGIINMTGFTYRRIPAMDMIKKLIDDQTTWAGFIIIKGGSMRTASLLRERRRSGDILKRLPAAVVLGDLASHTLDMALYLLGGQCSKIKDVYADASILCAQKRWKNRRDENGDSR